MRNRGRRGRFCDGQGGWKIRLVPRGKRQLFTGIGVHNVHDRLKLLYGDGFGLTISSEPGEGTRVKIRIPLLDR